MQSRLVKVVPVSIALGVIAVVLVAQNLHHVFPKADFFERQEWITYDWRARLALKYPAPAFTNFGAVFFDEDSLAVMNQPAQGQYRWPWPRRLYGEVVQELAAQGASAIVFDIFFLDRDRDYAETRTNLGGLGTLTSDAYFGWTLQRAGNVLLAAPQQEVTQTGFKVQMPADVFRTNALGVGFTYLEPDSDGVRRRCRLYVDDPNHGRVWNLGVLLAARHLQLDLARPEFTPGRVTLHGPDGRSVRIPVDRNGCLLVDWSIPFDDDRLLPKNYLMIRDDRTRRRAGERPEDFKGHLVILGAAGVGGNVGDQGPTPIRGEGDILCSSIWNIANSVLMNRWVRRAPFGLELGLILLMAAAAALLNWRLRALWASAGVLAIAAAYILLGVWAYVAHRYWLPLVLPVGGALLMTHVSMVAYRAVLELVERRRVQFIHSTIGRSFPELVDLLIGEDTAARVTPFLGLPPSVVRMLLKEDARPAGAAVRRPVSVYFADVRRFTEFVDRSQARAAERARQQHLTAGETEQVLDNEARDTLAAANVYLGTIAKIVKANHGTLDKYIGDSVMAFWGAPRADATHAAACVRAAVAVQEAINALNQERNAENQRREQENTARAARNEPPLPLLPILNIGTGINSGTAIVGFMGSSELMSNYTVFGADVNIASRLEAMAGDGRIIISEATFRQLGQHDPVLAATCIAREPVILKGIRDPVRIYEVPVG